MSDLDELEEVAKQTLGTKPQNNDKYLHWLARQRRAIISGAKQTRVTEGRRPEPSLPKLKFLESIE